ncbi:MAG TPA: response regulator [Thermoanaerobaculia bacterium]|nr:response regulator [Thermoanaerobaculia bacterium]
MEQATILVVDDSPTDLNLLLAALRPKGYRLLAARDGEEALEKAHLEHPDLILLDVLLPQKNGFQVCRQLKTAPETQDIKIILVTSKTQASDRFWGLKQGADDYLTKPLDDEHLLGAVEHLLGGEQRHP